MAAHSTPRLLALPRAIAHLQVAVGQAQRSARRLRGRRHLTRAASIELAILCQQVSTIAEAQRVIVAEFEGRTSLK